MLFVREVEDVRDEGKEVGGEGEIV